MGQSTNMLYSVFLSKLNTHSPIGSGVFFHQILSEGLFLYQLFDIFRRPFHKVVIP